MGEGMDERNVFNSAASTFIIRIWYEWSLTESRWYGRVEQLNTNQTMTFQELSQLLTFFADFGIVNEGERAAPDQGDEEDQV
jgi:hypothetical protein